MKERYSLACGEKKESKKIVSFYLLQKIFIEHGDDVISIVLNGVI